MKPKTAALVLVALATLPIASAWAVMPPITCAIPPIHDLRDSVDEVREITLAQLRFFKLYKDPNLASEAGRAADALDTAADGYLEYARDREIPPLTYIVDGLRTCALDLKAAGRRYADARSPDAALGALAVLDDAVRSALAVLKSADVMPPLTD